MLCVLPACSPVEDLVFGIAFGGPAEPGGPRLAELNERARRESGMTALYFAIYDGKLERALSTLKSGVPLDAPSLDLLIRRVGWSYVNSPEDQGRYYALLSQALLAAGLNPNVRNAAGDTPFLTAVRSGGHAYLSIIRKGVNVNARDKNGDNALFIYFGQGRVSKNTIHWLLEGGLDPLARNKKGQNILGFAYSRPQLEERQPSFWHDIDAMFEERGLDLDALDALGKSVRDYKREAGITPWQRPY